MNLHVARICYPVRTLGLGNRIVMWLQGCGLHCLRCANPELWERTDDTSFAVENVAETILSVVAQREVDGLTISGGEPFEQAEGLVALLKQVRSRVDDILVYSGRTRAQLEEMLPAPLWQEAQTLIDVLIDGPYIDERNDNTSALRGSDNQRIWYLNPAVQPMYEAYLTQGRALQNFYFDSTTITIGIHNRER